MTPKEKKAFVARMKKGKKNAANSASSKFIKLPNNPAANRLIGKYKTTKPKEFPAYTNIFVKPSGRKDGLVLAFGGYPRRNWNLISVHGMKDVIKMFKLKKL